MELTVNGVFKIQNRLCLSGEDCSVLARLYLPIIGIDGFSLYHLLIAINENELTFKKILDALNFPSLTYLNQAFAKLEAVSLITVYYNSAKKSYLFQINCPLSAEAFIATPLLFSFLRNQIGDIEIKKLTGKKSLSTRGYQNITRPFDKVYTVTEDNIKNVFTKMLNFKTHNKQIKVDYKEFDYIFFKL